MQNNMCFLQLIRGERILIIRFRRKTQGEWLALFILAMPFTFFLLMNMLHMPSMVKYTVVVAWGCLLVLLIQNQRNLLSKQTISLFVIVGLFFVFTLFGLLFNYQSIFYYLWGLRNILRFFVFFFACTLFIKESSVDNYLRLFDFLFWVNLIVVLYQFFIMGQKGDFLGGIFGVELGCNGYLNIFMMIVITKSILMYLNKQENQNSCILKCVVAMIIAALSELKFFYLEFIILLVMSILFTRYSFRKVFLVIATGLALYFGLKIINQLYPFFKGWLSIDGIMNIAGFDYGYTSENDINRLSAIPLVWERFLISWNEKLFGLGLGNCDYATFDFLTTPFYLQHTRLHYYWFSSSFLLLETGLVGTVLYLMFFIKVGSAAHKEGKTQKGEAMIRCQLAQIISIMCLFIFIYNGSLRTEAGYMIYFILALPFIRPCPKGPREMKNI